MKKIKKIVCPGCKRIMRNVIEVDMRVSILYFLNSHVFGNVQGPYYSIFKCRKKKRQYKILSLNCRFCGKIYPPKIQKELWKYLKYRKVLAGLQGDLN